MPSPDLSGYIDLSLFDKNPQDIYDDAINELLIRVPEFDPVEGTIEVELLEAIALQVAEAGYAINRVPGAVVQILLQLFGITMFEGTQPTANITFTLSDALGHEVPAGTQVRLALDPLEPVVFTTTEAGQANPGQTSITVTAQGDRFTADANGTAAGTSLTILAALYFVNDAQLATAPIGGVDPEDTPTWLARGMAALGRLTNTLATPAMFTAAALENPAIYRATTLDDWNAGLDPPQALAATPSGTGGTLVHAATYGFAVTAVTAQGETLPCGTVNATIPGAADTGSVALSWAAPAVQQGAGAVTGYKVYRTAANGAVLGLVATLGNVTSYTATGSAAPGAAPPIANGTGQSEPGYVTVGVYGEGAPVSSADKASLQTSLSAQAQANLNVRVVDATVNVVPVTVSVVATVGADHTQVSNDVTAAVQAFLSTDSWDWSAVLRRNELIAVIGSLADVAYVDVLTAPAADVNLAGIAPLAKAGTVTVTVE